MTFVKISAHTQMKVGEEEEMARKAQLRLPFLRIVQCTSSTHWMKTFSLLVAYKYFGGKDEDYKVKTTKCQRQDTANGKNLAILIGHHNWIQNQ